jgi:hypothetical protein
MKQNTIKSACGKYEFRQSLYDGRWRKYSMDSDSPGILLDHTKEINLNKLGKNKK